LGFRKLNLNQLMDFRESEKVKEYKARLKAFMDKHVYPFEQE